MSQSITSWLFLIKILTNLPSKKQNYLLGDVNLDGIINILDIIATVNFILSNEYNVSADLNDDSIINVLDIIELVNIIMN